MKTNDGVKQWLSIYLLIIYGYLACTAAGDKQPSQTVAICKAEAGCTFYKVQLTRKDIDRLLNRVNFFESASVDAILVLNQCEPLIEKGATPALVYAKYGGSGNVTFGVGFDLKEYLNRNSCFAFPNKTKRIDFKAVADGESYQGYAYLNIKKGEAFMPDKSFQAMYPAAEGEVKVDAFLQHRVMKQYIVDPEGKKWVMDMPTGLTFGKASSPEEAEKLERFNEQFKKTGKRAPFLQSGSYAEEYTGEDDEGNKISIWLIAAADVALPPDEPVVVGFYNLGYLQVNGITYLMCKLAGSGFSIEITGIRDEEYSFNPAGYTPFSMPL